MTTTNRGKVTDQIIAAAKNLLDIDHITTSELRLMPYVQYIMMNEQHIDLSKINKTERKILTEWQEKGWVLVELPG